jgi:hypothetical protein
MDKETLFWNLIKSYNKNQIIYSAIEKFNNIHLSSEYVIDKSNFYRFTLDPLIVIKYRQYLKFSTKFQIKYIKHVDVQYAHMDILKQYDLIPVPNLCLISDQPEVGLKQKPDLVMIFLVKHFESEDITNFEDILNYVENLPCTDKYFDLCVRIILHMFTMYFPSITYIDEMLEICSRKSETDLIEEYAPGRSRLLDNFFSVNPNYFSSCLSTITKHNPMLPNEDYTDHFLNLINYLLEEKTQFQPDADYYFSLAKTNLISVITRTCKIKIENVVKYLLQKFLCMGLSLDKTKAKIFIRIKGCSQSYYKFVIDLLVNNGLTDVIDFDFLKDFMLTANFSTTDIEEFVSKGIDMIGFAENICKENLYSFEIISTKNLWSYYVDLMGNLPQGDLLTTLIISIEIGKKDWAVDILDSGIIFDKDTVIKYISYHFFFVDNKFYPEIMDYLPNLHIDFDALVDCIFNSMSLLNFENGSLDKPSMKALIFRFSHAEDIEQLDDLLTKKNFNDYQNFLFETCEYYKINTSMGFHLVKYLIKKGADPNLCSESFKQMMGMCRYTSIGNNSDDINKYISWLEIANLPRTHAVQQIIKMGSTTSILIKNSDHILLSDSEDYEKFLDEFVESFGENNVITQEHKIVLYRKYDFSKLKKYMWDLIENGHYQPLVHNVFIWRCRGSNHRELSLEEILELVECGLDTSSDLKQIFETNANKIVNDVYFKYLLEKEFDLI